MTQEAEPSALTSPSQPAEKALSCPLCCMEAVEEHHEEVDIGVGIQNSPSTYHCNNCKNYWEGGEWGAAQDVVKAFGKVYTASDLQAAEVRGAEKFKRYLLDDFKVQFNLRTELESLSPASICRAALPKEEKP